MERISVNASGKYDVVIGRGLIGDSAGLISPLLGSGRLAVITDDNVKNFCLGRAESLAWKAREFLTRCSSFRTARAQRT